MWTQSLLHGLIVLLVFSTALAVRMLEKLKNGTVIKSEEKTFANWVSHGGDDATYGDVPYIAFTRSFCQGVILNRYTVLTFGKSCSDTTCDDCKPMKIKVGLINICAGTGSGHDVVVTKIIRHPLLSLVIFQTQEIFFNDFIKPIKLPKWDLNVDESTQVRISGWEGYYQRYNVSKYEKKQIYFIMTVFYIAFIFQNIPE